MKDFLLQVSTLLAVIVSAAATYAATSMSERTRWRREKRA